MSKMLMIIWGIIFGISCLAYGQEKFAVSGEIEFPEKKGGIFVQLKTEDEYNYDKTPPPERILMIKPNAQELKDKRVNFKFIDVPKGTYAIFCFQDVNENGIFDVTKSPTGSGAVMYSEPHGCAGWTSFGAGMWTNVKFEVDKDISGIKIKM